MLIWKDFNSFAIPYLILVAYFKNLIFQQAVLNSLQTQKSLELVFRSQFL